MKKLMFIFSICCMSYAAFSQDDVYYSDDASASASVGADVQINVAPPEIPVYAQPACPYDGYLWTPGYWAWGIGGYYWVPGVWIAPPRVGLLWTPGYWGFAGGYYRWHRGYWGEHIGFYGGVNYGCGYYGSGFYGGRWEGGHFRYNTAVVHVNTTVIHNTYKSNEGVIRNNNRMAFNGRGGVTVEPNSNERIAMNESHVQPTNEQQMHAQVSAKDRNQYVSANHGKPATAAMSAPNGRHYNSNGHPAGEQHSNTNRVPSNNVQRNNVPRNTAPRSNQPHAGAPQQRNQVPRNNGAPRSNGHGNTPRYNAPHNNPQPHNSAPRGGGNVPHNSVPRNGGGGHPSGGGRGGVRH